MIEHHDGEVNVSDLVKQYDALGGQLVDLTQILKEFQQASVSGNHQTVVHRTEGISPWSGAAIAACFFTFLGLILFAIVVMPELHDLKAWSDVYRGGISSLEENVKALKADKINREHK